MKLTRVQAQRILDKIEGHSHVLKSDLRNLRETIDAVFDEVDSLKEETHPCGYGYVEEGDW